MPTELVITDLVTTNIIIAICLMFAIGVLAGIKLASLL